MAIKKDISTEYGIYFNYHKISEVRVLNNDNNAQVRITVSSYADEEARKTGKTPVRKECIIENGEFALTAFYEILKHYFPDYQDGEDELTQKEKSAANMRVVEQSLISNNSKDISVDDVATTEEIETNNSEETEKENE